MGFMLAVVGIALAGAAVLWFVLSKRPRPAPPAQAASAAPRRRPEIDTGQQAPEPAAPEPEAPFPAELEGFRMLTTADLGEERRAELLAQLKMISLPPRSLQELMSPDFLASGATRELAEFIMREPVLAAKVLGRVNSPFYGLQSPIVSVQHAITFLGMNAVRNIALKFMMEESFRTEDPALQKVYGQVWDAGMVAADLCVLLSQKLGFADTGASSTQTVLSFVGEFALLSLQPAAAATWQQGLLGRTRAQQESLGLNATLAGNLLLREWGLPEGIVEGVEEIGALLAEPAPAQPSQKSLRLALCYACARIGEAIATGRLDDAAQVDLATLAPPEYFHVRSYLRQPAFARLGEHLQAPDTRNALARMILAASSR